VFENLGGFDAFVALLAARAGHFQVENGASPEQRNLQGNVQKLLLEANARIEAGGVPKPERRPMPPAPVSASTRAAAAGPARAAARGWWIGVAAALLLLGAVSWLAFARHDAAAGAAGPPAAAGAPAVATQPAIEATLLTGPADAIPSLITGAPPASPDPAATLKPTIVCRLLVAADGRVADAKIYRSRLDLATFEDAALDAVRQYHFARGRRAGRPVPVWINWPVTFR
ncbi:MAG TPA: energy transducer TonB, partial [Thermoanaerobaculia bacterium]